jgi:hypothetical protein
MTPEQERRITEALRQELTERHEMDVPVRIHFIVETFLAGMLGHRFSAIGGEIDNQNRVKLEFIK